MTRKSKREIERVLEEKTSETSHSSMLVVHEDPETGEWYDGTGEDADSVDEDDLDGADPLVVIVREEVVDAGWQEET